MPGGRLMLVPALAALAGCGGGTGTLSKSTVQDQIKAHESQLGTGPIQTVSCPKDLDAKKGASENCTIGYPSGSHYEVRATVTSVHGSTANFSLLVTRKID